jgi:hypothetical protein
MTAGFARAGFPGGHGHVAVFLPHAAEASAGCVADRAATPPAGITAVRMREGM